MTEERIGFTKVALPYGWMGNMSPYPINVGDTEWRTSEALFQAMRFDDEDVREAIRAEKSPMGAKFKMKANRDKIIVEPHSKLDIMNMAMCLNHKVQQHPKLKQLLIETGDAHIYEDVTARGDRGGNLFWGAMLVNGTLVGKNTLGKLWMSLRTQLMNS